MSKTRRTVGELSYNLNAVITKRRLMMLRAHPMRDDPAAIAKELKAIHKSHPITKWGKQEARAFAELFGNNHPSRGVVFRTAVEWCFGKDQQPRMLAAHIISSAIPNPRRARRASVHAKLLKATTKAMTARVVRERLN
jgi:hypothetical protein